MRPFEKPNKRSFPQSEISGCKIFKKQKSQQVQLENWVKKFTQVAYKIKAPTQKKNLVYKLFYVFLFGDFKKKKTR